MIAAAAGAAVDWWKSSGSVRFRAVALLLTIKKQKTMERYDYRAAVKADIKDYIKSNVDLNEYASKDDAYEDLNEKLWVCDSVTGNASGSYYCNAWKAAEALCFNWDLLSEALKEFGCGVDILEEGEEYCDVTIRCYLLGECLADVLDEYEEEGGTWKNDEGEE